MSGFFGDDGSDPAYALALSEMVQAQRNATRAALRKSSNPLMATQSLDEYVDAVVGRVRVAAEAGKRTPVACRSGCAWCCHQPIAVTADEVLRVLHQVERMGNEAQAAFWRRVADYAGRVGFPRLADAVVVRAAKVACPALGENRQCAVYAVRPAACRAMDSFDVTGCETSLVDSELRVEISHAIRYAGMVAQGHIEGLEASQRDARFYDLAAALYEAHGIGFAALKARWQRGEQVSSDRARCDEST